MSNDVEIQIRASAEQLKPEMDKVKAQTEDMARVMQAQFAQIREAAAKVETGIKTSMSGVTAATKTAATGIQNDAAAAKSSAGLFGSMFEKIQSASASTASALSGHAQTTKDALTGMAEKAAASGGGVTGALTSMRDAAMALPGPFKVAALALAGLLAAWKISGIVKDAVTETSKFTGEANKLARTLGITATAASTLNIALGDVYSDSDTYTQAAALLGRQLRKNEEALKDMGLQTRDAQGKYRNLNDLMMDSIGIVREYKEGTDRNQAAMAMWGRGATEVTGLLKLNNEVIAEAREKQESLGLIVGKENVEANKKYKAAMNDAGDVMQAIGKATGDAFMPVLTQLGEWFATIAPPAVFAFKIALSAVSTVIIGVMGFVESLAQALAGLAYPVTRFGSAIRNLLQGDMTAATKDMQDMFSGWGDAIDASAKKSEKSWSDATQRIKDQWGKPTETDAPSGNGKTMPPPKKDGESKSMMSEYQKELELMKAKQEAEKDYVEFSKQQEASFWADKAKQLTKGLDDESRWSDDAKQVYLKYLQAKGALNKEESDGTIKAKEREITAAKDDFDKQIMLTRALGEYRKTHAQQDAIKIAQIEQETADKIAAIKTKAKELADKLEIDRIKAKEKGELDDLALQEANANVMLQLGRITLEQKLNIEQKLADERFRIQTEALDAEIATLKKGTLEFQKAMERRKDIEQQYKLKTTQIDGNKEQAKQYNFGQAQQGFETGTMNAGAGALTSMLMKEKTSAQALRDLYKSVAGTFLSEMITKPIMWMAMRFIRESALYQGMMAKIAAYFGFQKTAEATSATTSIAAKKAAAVGTIPAEAATAAGGAAAAVAGIPVVGPAMAQAAYAETMTMVMGGLTVASASGGFDIPAGMNPMTQLHEKEMVLPSRYAEVIRGMAEGGGGGGGASGPVVNVHIAKAFDGNDVKRVLMANQGALVESLSKAYRNGHRP